MSAAKKEGKFGNVFWNLTNPYFDSNQVGGQIVDVGSSTGVEWAVRWVIGRRENLWPLLFAHVIGKPFEGVTAYFPTKKTVRDETVTDAMTGGLRRGIAVLIGKYIVNTAENGIQFKMPSFMDILITIGSKGLSASALSAIHKNLPEATQKQLEFARMQLQRYEENSNLTTDEKKKHRGGI